jgi:phage tail tape-measure protein
MRATRHTATIIALCALGLLAACGTTPKERTTGGAAAGAATGAGIGALAGPPGVVAGALIGGGAGAATGAATSPNQVNLGKPPWTNPETRVPTASGKASPTRHGRTDTSQNAAVDRLNDESLRSAQQGRTSP